MVRVFLFLISMLMAGLPALASDAPRAAYRGAAQAVDGDTLSIGGVRVRLHGIDAPEREQTCAGPQGDWPCGRWASRQLTQLIAGGLACDDRGQDRYGRVLSRCLRLSDNADVGALMVERGAAVAFLRYSDVYATHEARARDGRLGVWVQGGALERPEQFRAAQRPAVPRPAPSECTIKGNISDGGRIYHRPGQAFYDATRIDPARGERWFCSEAEARAAGFRPARR